jgi:hypothetical protein
MRSLLFASATLLAFAAFMVLQSSTAGAVVCARGIYRAGCAGPNGAVGLGRRRQGEALLLNRPCQKLKFPVASAARGRYIHLRL